MLEQLSGDVQKVETVRPHDHRQSQRDRLQRVMATGLDQAAADKGDIGQGVEKHQLAHAVAKQHLHLGANRLA